MEPVRFPFANANPAQPGARLMPLLPFTLAHGGQKVDVIGLLDTGSAASVLPYSVGEQLGLVWQQQRISVYCQETWLVFLREVSSFRLRSLLLRPRVWHLPGRRRMMFACCSVKPTSFMSSMFVSSALTLSSR